MDACRRSGGGGTAGGYFVYREFFSPNVHIVDRFYKAELSSYSDGFHVRGCGEKLFPIKNLVIHLKSFEWTAKELKYVNAVKPGRYLIKPNMNNKDLIALLHSGRQTPVEVVFNNIRTKEELADRIGAQ